MRITHKQLRKIIREAVLREQSMSNAEYDWDSQPDPGYDFAVGDNMAHDETWDETEDTGFEDETDQYAGGTDSGDWDDVGERRPLLRGQW